MITQDTAPGQCRPGGLWVICCELLWVASSWAAWAVLRREKISFAWRLNGRRSCAVCSMIKRAVRAASSPHAFCNHASSFMAPRVLLQVWQHVIKLFSPLRHRGTHRSGDPV